MPLRSSTCQDPTLGVSHHAGAITKPWPRSGIELRHGLAGWLSHSRGEEDAVRRWQEDSSIRIGNVSALCAFHGYVQKQEQISNTCR